MARTPKYDPQTGEPVETKRLALWQKLLAMLSLLLGGLGLFTTMSADPPPDPAPAERTSGGVGADGFVAGMPAPEGGTAGAEESELPLWAPLAAKGGLSFFLAFCVGYALRAAMKFTIIAVGVIALVVFGLQRAGVVESIDWSRAQGYWDDVTANLGTQFESLATFVKGSLPSAASAGVGLIAGFQRSR